MNCAQGAQKSKNENSGRESESHSVMSNSLRPHLTSLQSMDTGVGSLFFLQGIFPTQGSNPGLLHCRWILYQLSHQGSPRILEWVAYPSPADLPDPGIKPGSPALQADSLPTELSGSPIAGVQGIKCITITLRGY